MRPYAIAFIALLMLLSYSPALALTPVQKAWDQWADGDVLGAQAAAQAILRDSPTNSEAQHVLLVCRFVQGDYPESIKIFKAMNTSYSKYKEVGRLIVDAYVHLNQLENASRLASQLELETAEYLKERTKKPFSCDADETVIVPFSDGGRIPTQFMPCVKGTINGKEADIRFDTGGTYLVVGKEKAEELGISLSHEGTGFHGSTEVTVWRGIAEEMVLGEDLVFKNVPVGIMASLRNLAIIGTNIIDGFLATMDYPNSRFILTPRNRKDLYSSHMALLPKQQKSIPFFMWGDHFMFAKGSFGDNDGLTFFFDSGLVAITMVDGEMKQASFNASKERLLAWGFDEAELAQPTFLATEHSLGVAGLKQPNTLINYNPRLEKDREFGGVRMDGLISHAFLKNYSWTIDFDKHEYTFGVE